MAEDILYAISAPHYTTQYTAKLTIITPDITGAVVNTLFTPFAPVESKQNNYYSFEFDSPWLTNVTTHNVENRNLVSFTATCNFLYFKTSLNEHLIVSNSKIIQLEQVLQVPIQHVCISKNFVYFSNGTVLYSLALSSLLSYLNKDATTTTTTTTTNLQGYNVSTLFDFKLEIQKLDCNQENTLLGITTLDSNLYTLGFIGIGTRVPNSTIENLYNVEQVSQFCVGGTFSAAVQSATSELTVYGYLENEPYSVYPFSFHQVKDPTVINCGYKTVTFAFKFITEGTNYLVFRSYKGSIQRIEVLSVNRLLFFNGHSSSSLNTNYTEITGFVAYNEIYSFPTGDLIFPYPIPVTVSAVYYLLIVIQVFSYLIWIIPLLISIFACALTRQSVLVLTVLVQAFILPSLIQYLLVTVFRNIPIAVISNINLIVAIVLIFVFPITSAVQCIWYKNYVTKSFLKLLLLPTIIHLVAFVVLEGFNILRNFIALNSSQNLPSTIMTLSYIQLAITVLLGPIIVFSAAKIRQVIQMQLQNVHTQKLKDEDLLNVLLNAKQYKEMKEELESNALNSRLFKIKMEEISNLEEIGSGATGLILKAKWSATNQTIAVKLFRGTISKDSFMNELSLLCSLRHPNLVNVYGAIMEDPRYVAITEDQ